MSRAPGILPAQAIRQLAADRALLLDSALAVGQVQPASLDLRLGATAHRVKASFLPGRGRPVADRLADITLHEVPLGSGAVLETGCVYIVPLQERLALPEDVSASCNPKSSTGRLDIFTRVITDGAQLFDKVPAGYRGPLFAEISPTTFPVKVRTGSRLSQIRFRRGMATLDPIEISALHASDRLVDADDAVMGDSVAVSVDLAGSGGLVGYRAKKHAGLVDVDVAGALDRDDYWEPLKARSDRTLILDPDAFYILASKEAVHVPPTHAAEMVAFDPLVGEFRVHYAGFFDPGFGHAPAGGTGARAVLEVRSREVPFILEHGQTVGRLVYERMAARPDVLYGQDLASNYQAQGLKLSKHFR